MALEEKSKQMTGIERPDRSVQIDDLLNQRTVPELHRLAAKISVKGVTKLRKTELIQAVKAALLKKERLREALYPLEPAEWNVFQRAAASEQGAVVRTELEACPQLQWLGYLCLYRHEGILYYAVPEEVREVYQELLQDGFRADKRRGDLIHAYAAAAVNLYGAILQDDFLDIFNWQNGKKLTEKELSPVLSRHIDYGCDYVLWKDFLVHNAFEDNKFRDVPDLLERVGDKPRYIPEKRELLKYADPDYFEPCLAAVQMEHYLKENAGLPKLMVEEVMSELHFAILLEAAPMERMEILRAFDVDVPGEKIQDVLDMLSGMANGTRLWSNNGYTPDELFDLLERKQLRTIPPKAVKIGRNDPCPCGSGRKFKKCCGR